MEMECCVPTATHFVCNNQVTPVDRLQRPAKVEIQEPTLPLPSSLPTVLLSNFFRRLGGIPLWLSSPHKLQAGNIVEQRQTLYTVVIRPLVILRPGAVHHPQSNL